jgi:hypothetical protein
VLARVQPALPARTRWRWPIAGIGLAAAAAVLFLVVPRHAHQSATPSAFRAKGLGSQHRTPVAGIECLGGTLAACPTGSLLVVRVAGVRGFVSAWAEPAAGGERIWYFSAETVSPVVDGVATDSTPTSRAIKLGPEHRPGAYAVEIRVTEKPMPRGELLQLPPGAALVTARAALSVASP